MRQQYVAEDGPHGVGHRVLPLPYEVAHQHAHAVARQAAPGAGHIAHPRHEDHVHRHQHGAAHGAHHGAPPRLPAELVPEAQVEIDTHQYLRHHHHRYRRQRLPVVGAHQVAEHIHIAHHRQERQQREHDEILGGLRLRLLALLVALAAEDEGLVGVAEGLCDDGHDHRYLHAGTVEAQLHSSLATGQQHRQQYLVGHLVEDAHHPEEQQRPRVLQHLPQQATVEERRPVVAQLAHEAQGDQRRAQQVDIEDVAHIVSLAVPAHPRPVGPLRRHDEDKQVQRQAGHYEAQLKPREVPRLPLLAQPREEDGLESVQRHHAGHHPQVLRVVGVAHDAAYGAYERHHQRHKHQRHRAHGRQRRAVHAPLVAADPVGEIEIGRLHAEGQYHQQQRRVGVDVGHHPVAARGRRDVVSVYRDKQIVQKSANDAAQAVDHRV